MPSKETDASNVGPNVDEPSSIVALLHGWDAGCGQRPETDQSGTSIQVRARKELARTGVRVQWSLYRHEEMSEKGECEK